MPSICFYFQVHQPERLRRFSIFKQSPEYFDDAQNAEILRKVAAKCYLPCNKLLLRLIQRHRGAFKVAFSLTGVVIEQFERYAPDVLASFQELARTGCVEFLSETYYHSLSFLYSREEWAEQVAMHQTLMDKHFGVRPTVFRNTELIYSNELAVEARRLGYRVALCDGPAYTLAGQNPTRVYLPPDVPDLRLLVKHGRLSDDIAFRFSNRHWPSWPLMADKYARWVHEAAGRDGVVNLFMDYETFGEHQWAETGIFDFLEWLPREWLALPGTKFLTPSEAAASMLPAGEYDVPHMTSWADAERDLSAWLGNAMQSNALFELFALEPDVKAAGDALLLADWRRLQISDHFYYMSTKHHADGIVHRYFNPYDTPYDAFINFMNVLDHLRTRL
jgi:alpha-amylase